MEIIFIGTVHNMLPGAEIELKEVLEKVDPSVLCVEIVQEEIGTEKFKSAPMKMQFAFNWGIERKIEVFGFDFPLEEIKPGVTKESLETLVQNEILLLQDYPNLSWKDFNRKSLTGSLMQKLDEMEAPFIDMTKRSLRQDGMLKNLYRVVSRASKKRVLVLTGVSHLDFFGYKLPDAIFPLAD